MARCTNSEPGTFNHECGRPAVWAGRHRSGHVQRFCDRCKRQGYEARGVVEWIAEAATEPTPAGLQFVMPGCEKDQSRGPKQLSLF